MPDALGVNSHFTVLDMKSGYSRLSKKKHTRKEQHLELAHKDFRRLPPSIWFSQQASYISATNGRDRMRLVSQHLLYVPRRSFLLTPSKNTFTD